jgi:cell wall-associated NlpC family hydrolase
MRKLSVSVCGFFLVGIFLVSGCASVKPVLNPASEEESLDREQTKILSIAKGLLGTQYRFGGTNPNTGFDCSGYVAYVYSKAVGISLPRQSREQIETGTPVADSLQAGDMVYFKISEQNRSRRPDWHTGIYIGKGNFIHAPRTAGAVNIQDISLPYWKKRFVGARRLL